MQRRDALAACALAILSGALPTAAWAGHRELLRYRLLKPRTIHAKSEADAKSYLAALNKLSCACQMDNHGSHIDVVYHCPDWAEAEFKDHATAHHWEKWLKALGFEVLHQH